MTIVSVGSAHVYVGSQKGSRRSNDNGQGEGWGKEEMISYEVLYSFENGRIPYSVRAATAIWKRVRFPWSRGRPNDSSPIYFILSLLRTLLGTPAFLWIREDAHHRRGTVPERPFAAAGKLIRPWCLSTFDPCWKVRPYIL